MSSASKKPEVVAKKSIDSVTKDLVELQTKVRSALSDAQEAFIQKNAELEASMEEIASKKAEMEELHGKEQILLEISRLEDALKDKQHEHARALKSLEISHEDKMAELKRSHAQIQLAEKQKNEDERRARAIKWDDEDRARELDFQRRMSEMDVREAKLADLQVELGDFDKKVEAKVAQQVNAIKRELQFKADTETTKLNAQMEILQARITNMMQENNNLTNQLNEAKSEAKNAIDKANAIAIATVHAESGKQALDEIRAVAQKQAESKR